MIRLKWPVKLCFEAMSCKCLASGALQRQSCFTTHLSRHEHLKPDSWPLPKLAIFCGLLIFHCLLAGIMHGFSKANCVQLSAGTAAFLGSLFDPF